MGCVGSPQEQFLRRHEPSHFLLLQNTFYFRNKSLTQYYLTMTPTEAVVLIPHLI